MAKIDERGGTSYAAPGTETWEPTMHLAFFAVRDDPEPGAALTAAYLAERPAVRKLHQQWRSNIGRVRWRPVVEMDPHCPDNE